MKAITFSKILSAVAACASIFLTTQTQAQDVGVTVQFGQPGFYGHVDIGSFPQSRVIFRETHILHLGALRSTCRLSGRTTRTQE